MKERPILFTPENAQKCHDARKTMTRRTNGLEMINEHPGRWVATGIDGDGAFMFRDGPIPDGWKHWISITCPYGQVGDWLWVRESFRLIDYQERHPGPAYKGEGIKRLAVEKWKPSIHMPRWACRTVLEITDICVQRLIEIPQLDALHEGCDGPDYKASFSVLWESINGKGSWHQNPYVWVIEFRKVTA